MNLWASVIQVPLKNLVWSNVMDKEGNSLGIYPKELSLTMKNCIQDSWYQIVSFAFTVASINSVAYITFVL
jgi:hypothetical protein